MKNLDRIIIVIKNWPDDPCLDCTSNINLKEYIKVEVILAKKNYELIEKIEYFEKLHIDED